MDGFQAALAIGALVAAVLSWREPRGIAWIVAGATSFVLTAGWEAQGWAYHPVATGLADAAVCLLIYLFAAQRWEIWLYRIFLASLLISGLRVIGLVPSHKAYVIGLELCNWAALAVIGGTPAGEEIGVRLARLGPVRPAVLRVRRAVAALRAPRATPPFTRVP